tara:strand:+ start:258 stop:605 length:348 start_codon:yes stop_codon:yes gene_type:complete
MLIDGLKVGSTKKLIAMWRELPEENYWLIYTNDKSIVRKLKRGKKRKAELFNNEVNADGATFRLYYKYPKNAILGLKRLIHGHNYQEVRFDPVMDEFIAEYCPKVDNKSKLEVSK